MVQCGGDTYTAHDTRSKEVALPPFPSLSNFTAKNA